MMKLSAAVLLLLAPAALAQDECVCLVEGGTVGSLKGLFDVTFVPNPNPDEEQAHGNGDCNWECTLGYGCRVNGTLTIQNNSTVSVAVNWQSTPGGTPIAPGQTAEFATGYKRIACGDSKRIEFTATSGARGAVASYQWTCNSCAAPPAGE